MCGIAGLYAFSPSAPPADRAELRTIRDHKTARGPDGQGEWFSADSRVALGHRRLAIIDLSEGGAQPMQSADGQIDIAPEPAGHTGFFLWGSVPAPWTLYRGIRALPAGHTLWVGGQGIEVALSRLGADELFASYPSFADWIYFH